MKKFLFPLVAIITLASCATQEEKEAKFKAQVEEIVNGFYAQVEVINADTTKTDIQKSAEIDSIYQIVNKEYIAVNKNAFNKNKDNRIALIALSNMMGELSDTEILEMIEMMADSLQTNETVVKIKKFTQASLNTAEGSKFVDFTIEDSDGKSVSFSDYVGKGNYVLVDFWASWCGPCKKEIPNIKSIYEKYSDKGLTVLSIAVWDNPEATKKEALEHGIVWDQIINAQNIPTDLYGIQGIPQIMLFAPDGTILKKNLRGEEIEEEIKKYL